MKIGIQHDDREAETVGDVSINQVIVVQTLLISMLRECLDDDYE